jgi:hypothetical protein
LSTSVNDKPASSTIHLSPVEIAQRRKDGKCFHCDEFFTNSRKLLCNQLFIIEVLSEGEEDDGSSGKGESTISNYALTGIQSRHGRMMQLHVTINGAKRALLDSRSTHNFIDTEVAVRVGLILASRSSLHVAMANGDRLTSPRGCKALAISIVGEQFHIDFYGIALESYEMVLGIQWLESLGPILWDFDRRTLA